MALRFSSRAARAKAAPLCDWLVGLGWPGRTREGAHWALTLLLTFNATYTA
jgi:hypothetical protein